MRPQQSTVSYQYHTFSRLFRGKSDPSVGTGSVGIVLKICKGIVSLTSAGQWKNTEDMMKTCMEGQWKVWKVGIWREQWPRIHRPWANLGYGGTLLQHASLATPQCKPNMSWEELDKINIEPNSRPWKSGWNTASSFSIQRVGMVHEEAQWNACLLWYCVLVGCTHKSQFAVLSTAYICVVVHCGQTNNAQRLAF